MVNAVYLFIPNLIGFSRIALVAVALAYLPSAPYWAMALYVSSCLLDALDGHAARYFDQCSKFGAVLDMVTDRCTTTCLLCHLSAVYPAYSLLFQFLISLDLASHYMQMYSSLTTGSSSHKTVTHGSAILRLYYSNPLVLFGVCAGDQLFFIALYLLRGRPDLLAQGLAAVSGLAGAKHSAGAAPLEAALITAALLLSGPVCLFKQFTNVVQLVGSAQELTHLDLREREKGKAKQK